MASAGIAIAAAASLGMGCGLSVMADTPAGAATAGTTRAATDPLVPTLDAITLALEEAIGVVINGVCSVIHVGAGSICDPVP
jgi:hypothetical protein